MIAPPIIDLKGVDEALVKLERRIKRLASFHTPLTEIADDFFNVQREWMDTEGRGSWKPLSRSYAAEKARRYPGRKILVRTGDMRADFTGETRGGLRIRRDRLTIRTVRSGTRWLDHTRGRDARPKRQVLSPAMRIRRPVWTKIMTQWLVGK